MDLSRKIHHIKTSVVYGRQMLQRREFWWHFHWWYPIHFLSTTITEDGSYSHSLLEMYFNY